MFPTWSAGDELTSAKLNQTGVAYLGASAVGTDSYAVNPTLALSAYSNGVMCQFKADVANTGAATLNVSALGAKKIYLSDGVELPTGAIKINSVVTVVYNSSWDSASGAFRLVESSEQLVDGSATNLHYHKNLLASSINTTLTANTTEQTVATYTMPAGILSTVHGLRIKLHACYTPLDNGDNVTYRFKLGGTTFDDYAITGTGAGALYSVIIECIVLNTAANAQKNVLSGLAIGNLTITDVIDDVATSAVDTSGSIAVAVTSQLVQDAGGGGTPAVTIKECTIEYLFAI